MSDSKIHIRPARPSDGQAIAEIYNHYIANTVITFELEVVDAAEMSRRIEQIMSKYPYLVLEVNSEVVAYAYATEWKERKAYAQTCESSIYVAPKQLGQTYGKSLYTALLKELESYPIKRVLGGIALPNPASIRLHEKLGFVFQGTLEKVGYKFKKWVDVGYWQLFLD